MINYPLLYDTAKADIAHLKAKVDQLEEFVRAVGSAHRTPTAAEFNALVREALNLAPQKGNV